MINEAVLRNRLAEKTADVLAYRGGPAFVEFIGLLEAIEDCYKEELLSVPRDQLDKKQGAAKQVRLLRSILSTSRADAITDLPTV